MSDRDFIQPAERGHLRHTPEVSALALIRSHVVADSVMRDLAEALRELVDVFLFPDGMERQIAALARFDALNGDKR